MLKKIYILAASLALSLWVAKADDLAIVVAKSSALDNLTSADLTKIFRAEKAKAPDGTKFVLALPAAGSPEHAAMLEGIYGMDEAAFGKYFLQATFTGLVTAAPKQISGGAALCAFAAGTPGGITCVKAGDAGDSVKIVKVDGHAPGDPDYKLKIK